MATVQLSRGAETDVAKADGSSKDAILKGLAKLRVSPELRGAPLRDELDGLRKLTLGSHNMRIVYRYDSSADVVRVIAIGLRRDEEVYRLALARLSELDDPK